MKLATMAAVAALTALALAASPAQAGKKGKQQWSEHGNVHIDSHVSSKNLKSLERQLKGHQKRAVSEELGRRQLSYEKRSQEKIAKPMGEAIATGKNPIIDLWAIGSEYGTRRKGHH